MVALKKGVTVCSGPALGFPAPISRCTIRHVRAFEEKWATEGTR
jgi:hypothetical protein